MYICMYTRVLLTFDYVKLTCATINCLISFFIRGRFPKTSWETPIPEESKLKDDDLTAFVECLKPAIMLAVFNKSGSTCQGR